MKVFNIILFLLFFTEGFAQTAHRLPYLSAVQLIEVVDENEKKGDKELARLALSAYHLHIGNLKRADSLATSLLVSSNKDIVFRAYMMLARLNLIKGVYDEARAMNLKATDMASKANNTALIQEARLLSADITAAIGNLSEARKLANGVLVVAANEKLKPLEAQTRITLGEIALKGGDTANAIVYFNDAGELFTQLDLYYLFAIAQSKKALCLPAVNKTAEAKEIYSKLMFYFYNNQELLLAASIQLLYGNLLFSEQDINGAMFYYTNALKASRDASDKGLELIALMSLSASHKSLGNGQEALTYFKTYETLKQQLLSEKTLLNMKGLEGEYENTQKTRLITQLENEVMLVNTNLKLKQRQQVILYVLVVFALLLLVLSFLLFRQRMHKKEVMFHSALNDTLNRQEIATMDAIMETQESERKRIAGDLHDRIGSMLATVKLQFKSAEQVARNTQPDLAAKMAEAATLLDEITAEVRRISHNMESGVLAKFGLAAALSDLATQLNQTSLINISFANNLRGVSLSDKTEVTLYRCCQELVTNAIKHASAHEIGIELNGDATHVNMMVTDNGKGFKPSEIKEGMGMKQIRNRVQILNGTVNIDSHQQAGTTIIIEIPL